MTGRPSLTSSFFCSSASLRSGRPISLRSSFSACSFFLRSSSFISAFQACMESTWCAVVESLAVEDVVIDAVGSKESLSSPPAAEGNGSESIQDGVAPCGEDEDEGTSRGRRRLEKLDLSNDEAVPPVSSIQAGCLLRESAVELGCCCCPRSRSRCCCCWLRSLVLLHPPSSAALPSRLTNSPTLSLLLSRSFEEATLVTGGRCPASLKSPIAPVVAVAASPPLLLSLPAFPALLGAPAPAVPAFRPRCSRR